MVVDFRRRTLLPLDDLLVHLRETLPPLRIPDSVGVIDFHALERASLPPDGHPKLLHLWPVKLLQTGRSDGDYTGVAVMREAASFKR